MPSGNILKTRSPWLGESGWEVFFLFEPVCSPVAFSENVGCLCVDPSVCGWPDHLCCLLPCGLGLGEHPILIVGGSKGGARLWLLKNGPPVP